MKKKKKAFTLIELLAIIVILSIIAVITVPIILEIVENSKKGAIKDSAYGYLDAINKNYLEKLSDDVTHQFPSGIYDVSGGILIKGAETLDINVSGRKPTGGYISITNRVISGCLQYDEYKIEMENGGMGSAEKGICIKSLGFAKDLLISNPEGVTASEKSSYVNYIDKNGNTILSRVLYNDETHGVQIISFGSVQNVILGKVDPIYKDEEGVTELIIAQNSYNNAIKNLNNYAMNYLNTDLANDARCVGSLPTVTNGMMENKNHDEPVVNPKEYDFVEPYMDDYRGDDTNYEYDLDRMIELGINNIGIDYWFASHYFYSTAYASNPYQPNNIDMKMIIIGINQVSSSGSKTTGALIREYSGRLTLDDDRNFGLRPVFLLKDNVIITDGDGTQQKPYILLAK